MSDEIVDKPAPIPAVQMNGAVNLAASVLRDRVKDILELRLSRPFGIAPVLREGIGMATPQGHTLTAADAKMGMDELESKWWSIVTRLRVLGVSESDGDFALVEIGHGERNDGQIFAQFVLTWTPRMIAASKPTLSLAPEDERVLAP